MRVINHSKTIADMITCVYDSLICKLVPPLLRNIFVTISRPILHITAQIRCPCFQNHSWINYVCLRHAMQILKCQHYRKCDFCSISSNIASKLKGFFEGIYLWNCVVFCDQRLIWGSIQGIVNKEIPLSLFIIFHHHFHWNGQSQTHPSLFSTSSSSSRSPVSRRSTSEVGNAAPQDHTGSNTPSVLILTCLSSQGFDFSEMDSSTRLYKAAQWFNLKTEQQGGRRTRSIIILKPMRGWGAAAQRGHSGLVFT